MRNTHTHTHSPWRWAVRGGEGTPTCLSLKNFVACHTAQPKTLSCQLSANKISVAGEGRGRGRMSPRADSTKKGRAVGEWQGQAHTHTRPLEAHTHTHTYDALKKNSLVKFANYHIFIKKTKFQTKPAGGRRMAARGSGKGLFHLAVERLPPPIPRPAPSPAASVAGNHRRATLTSLLILLKIIL